jgi:hypothetical protein
MVGLIVAIIVFNVIAFKTNRTLTAHQILHIWMFTIAFQQLFDLMIEYKYHGYWYFDREIDWLGLLPHTLLIPPVNIMFLNWYPVHKTLIQKAAYIVLWVIFILLYEVIAKLPEPWGYFHYGWWRLWHAAIVDPFLLLILLGYYKLISRLEKRAIQK